MKNNALKETRNYNFWILFLFFGIFNNFIFYYIGIRSKYRRYIQFGHFFTLLWLLYIFSLIIKNHSFSSITPLIYMFSYPAGIYLGFSSRKYYSYRLILLKEIDSLNLISQKITVTDNYDLYYLINSTVPEPGSVFE